MHCHISNLHFCRFVRQYLIARSLEWQFLKKKTPAFFEVFVKVAKIQRYEAGATIFQEGVRAFHTIYILSILGGKALKILLKFVGMESQILFVLRVVCDFDSLSLRRCPLCAAFQKAPPNYFICMFLRIMRPVCFPVFAGRCRQDVPGVGRQREHIVASYAGGGRWQCATGLGISEA